MIENFLKNTTNNILLIRPANFSFNSETAGSNVFQNEMKYDFELIKNNVLNEFEIFSETLNNNGINTFVFDDTETPIKPDAVFPNNWISFHNDGKVIIYPMLAENRRLEKRNDIIEKLNVKFNITEIIDLSYFENENKFLEGTGSIVFDHKNKIAYASLSPRTNEIVLNKLCEIINYKPLVFHSYDINGNEIYHTNVMMTIGENFAVVCLESINNEKEKNLIINSLQNSGKEIIPISIEQMYAFAGNMLELINNSGENLLVLSQSAFNSLSSFQKEKLKQYAKLLPLNVNNIETIGGGSVRCMIAEIYL